MDLGLQLIENSCEYRVCREEACAKDQDEDRCEQKCVGISGIELSRIGEEGAESLIICRDIGNQHIAGQKKPCQW